MMIPGTCYDSVIKHSLIKSRGMAEPPGLSDFGKTRRFVGVRKGDKKDTPCACLVRYGKKGGFKGAGFCNIPNIKAPGPSSSKRRPLITEGLSVRGKKRSTRGVLTR